LLLFFLSFIFFSFPFSLFFFPYTLKLVLHRFFGLEVQTSHLIKGKI